MGWLWASIVAGLTAIVAGIAAALYTRVSEKAVDAAWRRLPELLQKYRRRANQPDAEQRREDGHVEQAPPKNALHERKPVVIQEHDLGSLKPDETTIAVMMLFIERTHLTAKRVSELLGCPLAAAEYRLELLQSHRMAAWSSFGAEGRDFHLTLKGKDWLHRHGFLP